MSFEVEAENEEEAKDVAIDTYVNSDRLQDIMVHDDESIASSEAKVLHCLGEANGIVCEDKEKEGRAKCKRSS